MYALLQGVKALHSKRDSRGALVLRLQPSCNDDPRAPPTEPFNGRTLRHDVQHKLIHIMLLTWPMPSHA